MINWLKKYYFQLQIIVLAFFKPTDLFERINQLEWYKNLLRQWVDDQKLIANSTVLEAGCATGALTAYLSQSGYITMGIDASSNMIELAKAKHHHIEFLVAKCIEITFWYRLF